MQENKARILSQLQKEILPLQGFKPAFHNTILDQNIGFLKEAFPNATFPLGALHEFVCEGEEAAAATTGFVSAIVTILMRSGGTTLWLPGNSSIFPPALLSFGIAPERVIFLDLTKEKEILWVMEEALRCGGLAAVIGEVSNLSFTASRRLQLAVEQSKVTGFIYRSKPRQLTTTASLARWKVTSLSSQPGDLPGISFPRWNVELLKVRNGTPGSWQVEWLNGALRNIEQVTTVLPAPQKKTA